MEADYFRGKCYYAYEDYENTVEDWKLAAKIGSIEVKNDMEALQKLFDSNRVFLTKDGLKVSIVESEMFSGIVKVRIKGELTEFYTDRDAVE